MKGLFNLEEQTLDIGRWTLDVPIGLWTIVEHPGPYWGLR
jgi:hypothetical protein